MASMLIRLVCLAIVCLALGANVPNAEASVTCDEVVNNLTPCISYVVYGGNTVPTECCHGVKNVLNMAKTTPDRRTACNCIKNAVASSGFTYTNFNLNNAAALPKKCGIDFPYAINPNTDCSSVQ